MESRGDEISALLSKRARVTLAWQRNTHDVDTMPRLPYSAFTCDNTDDEGLAAWTSRSSKYSNCVSAAGECLNDGKYRPNTAISLSSVGQITKISLA